MRPGVLFYRCRLCGDQIEGDAVVDVAEAMNGAIVDVETFEDDEEMKGPKIVHLFGLHRCDGGRVGIMDLIGAVGDEGAATAGDKS